MRENDDEPTGDEPETAPGADDDEAADAEQDDDEPADEPADDPGDDAAEHEIADELSERAVKARDKALEKEYTRHEGALERAWGALWEQFHVCPLCEGDGFMVPRPAGAMPEEQFAAVYAFAGYAQPVELPPDQDYTVCENCKGWGSTTIAGSAREGLSKQCDRCLGNGYAKSTAVNVVPIVPVIPGPQAPQLVPAPQSYGAPGQDDQWGRPAGHPHYGIPPAAVT